MMDQPSTQEMRMHCRACHHIWTGHILVNVPIRVTAAHMRLLRCPECDSKRIDYVIDEDKLRAKLEAKQCE